MLYFEPELISLYSIEVDSGVATHRFDIEVPAELNKADVRVAHGLASQPTATPAPNPTPTTTPQPQAAARDDTTLRPTATPSPGQIPGFDSDEFIDRIPGGAMAALFLVPTVFAVAIAGATRSPPATLMAFAGAMAAVVLIGGLSPWLFILVGATAISGVIMMMAIGWKGS